MKVRYIGIIRNDSQPGYELAFEKYLEGLSRFTKGGISEFMSMFARTVAERTKPGQRHDVLEQEHIFHAYARSEGICGVMITDEKYPILAAHSVLSKVVDEFLASNPASSWSSASQPGKPKAVVFPQLKTYIDLYQNPAEADSIMKIQRELDETKIVLHKTIESVLERGEKIEDLVAKSDSLSAQSKMFYTSAKNKNSCCLVM